MRLIVQVVGLLVVAAMVGRWQGRGGSRQLSSTVTLVAVAVAAISVWTELLPLAQRLVTAHRQDAKLTRTQAYALPGTLFGANEPFLAWVDGHVPRHTTIYLECGQPTHCGGGSNEWITYRLSPRLFVTSPARASWVMFYGAEAGGFAYTRGFSVSAFQPGFDLGHRVLR